MNEKKEKFIIFVLAGILLMIVCMPVKKEKKASTVESLKQEAVYKETVEADETGTDTEDSYAYAKQMEQELEALLQYMDGVGRVKVMITLRSTGEDIVEKDRPANRSNISENDGGGGVRNTSDMVSEETTVFITDAGGKKIPYVRKTLQPVIEGVAVLAEGGGSEIVCQNIREAIQALFGIDANKIKIAKMKTVK